MSLVTQLGGMWGGCSAAYGNFSAKWGSLLDANITAEEIEEMGLTADWQVQQDDV